jgi:hypothetical protein
LRGLFVFPKMVSKNTTVMPNELSFYSRKTGNYMVHQKISKSKIFKLVAPYLHAKDNTHK